MTCHVMTVTSYYLVTKFMNISSFLKMPARALGCTPHAQQAPRPDTERASSAPMASKLNNLLVFGHAALRCDTYKTG